MECLTGLIPERELMIFQNELMTKFQNYYEPYSFVKYNSRNKMMIIMNVKEIINMKILENGKCFSCRSYCQKNRENWSKRKGTPDEYQFTIVAS